MNKHIFLEVGNMTGIAVMIFMMIGIVSLVVSCLLALIFQFIYNSRNEKALTRGQYWLAVLVCLMLCGIVTGAICL